MNPRQAVGQLRKRLRDRTWSEASGAKVFGSVHVTHLPLGQLPTENYKLPLLLLRIGANRPDPKLPGRSTQTIIVEHIGSTQGDRVGEAVIMGAGVADRTKSAGKGMLWAERELTGVIRQLQNVEGIRIVGRRTGAQQLQPYQDNSVVGTRLFELGMDITDEPYYHPVKRIFTQDDTGGLCTITWTDPPTRWDTRPTTPIVIRRAAGNTAPASVTAGTAVTKQALGVETYQDDPGAGTFSYAIFVAYTDTLKDEEQSYSAQEIGTYKTQVVT